MEDKLQAPALAAEVAADQESMSAGSQAAAANGQSEAEAAKATTPTTTADIELEGLALSSSITELVYALEAVSTLIFEIQELRHNAAQTSQSEAGDSQTSQVDASLLKLDEQLAATSKEVDGLQTRLNSYLKTQTAGLLRSKWTETLTVWQKLQKEAEDMREELVEDKYLTVYRTVSRQAEDMMQSLEKIFAQCNTFVHETYKSRRTQPSPTAENLQVQLSTFIGLHKSLHQKTKYYIPSCEKVLKVIDSGISQQKRSLNGEILRSHADMKLRWRNLQEQMSRTEKEMQGVQELLSDMSAKASQAGQHVSVKSIVSSSASSGSRKSSASTPSRSPITTARNKVGDWLSPSPPARQSVDSKSLEPGDSPLQSRPITPFRRLANRLHKSKNIEVPFPTTMPNPGTSSSSSRTSGSPETQLTLLPTAGLGIGHATPTKSAPSMPRTVSSPATVEKQQRRYSRVPGTEASSTPNMPPPRQSYISSAVSERARSPLPPPPPRPSSSIGTAAGVRPPWNAGTRLTRETDLGASLSSSSVTKGRKSLPSGGTARNASNRYSHITSTYSQNRPQSRIFTTPSSSSFRPPSPALSATSAVSSSAARPRPSSPNSRIPAPGSTGSTPQRGTRRPHEGSPGRADDMETLYFGAAEPEEGATSLMQRALSPTPSQSGFSVTSSTAGTPGGSRRHSRIPRLSLGESQLPDPRMLDLPPPPKLPDAYASSRSDIMTPEPTLRSRAARVSAMYGRPSMTGRKSLGPGVIPSSSEHLSSPQSQRSLTASTSGMRPSSRLSVSTSRAGGGGRRSSFYAPSTSSRLATPLPDMPDGSIPYYPNRHDPLDVEIAEIVNSQPLYVYCQREDPHLSKAAAEAQSASDRMARYWLAQSDKPILCKLIDRGDRKPKKVLCKITGEWQDLSIYLLNQQAQY